MEENKKIKLLVVTPNKTGVGYYRSIKPHTYLDEFYNEDIEISIVENPPYSDINFGLGFDIVHFHSIEVRFYDSLIIKLEQLKKEGVKLVMDLDDYWILPTHFPQYNENNVEHKLHLKIIDLIKKSDYITTTTPIFAKEIEKYNKNVFVLPNSIDGRERQFQKIDVKSDRLRVGIICGSSHEKDVDLLKGMVNQLGSDIDKLQFVVCGFDLSGTTIYIDPVTKERKSRNIRPDETVWTKYEKILTNNYSIISDDYKNYLFTFNNAFEYPNAVNEPYRRFWTKPVNQYATHYNNIDVLLAPLEENIFDSTKSQLKVVEAGFFNKVIIAQDFGPYKIDLNSYVGKNGEINENGNALLVETSKNHKQWAKHIKFLLNNPDARIKIANNLNDKITKEYSLEETSKKRIELYKNIVKND